MTLVPNKASRESCEIMLIAIAIAISVPTRSTHRHTVSATAATQPVYATRFPCVTLVAERPPFTELEAIERSFIKREFSRATADASTDREGYPLQKSTPTAGQST